MRCANLKELTLAFRKQLLFAGNGSIPRLRAHLSRIIYIPYNSSEKFAVSKDEGTRTYLARINFHVRGEFFGLERRENFHSNAAGFIRLLRRNSEREGNIYIYAINSASSSPSFDTKLDHPR